MSERTHAETPARASKALEFLTSGYELTLPDVIGRGVFEDDNEEEEDDGLDAAAAARGGTATVGFDGTTVEVADVRFFSMCEHHLLPFFGVARVKYTPRGRVLGLSKVARIIDLFARRLQLQERLTRQVTNKWK